VCTPIRSTSFSSCYEYIWYTVLAILVHNQIFPTLWFYNKRHEVVRTLSILCIHFFFQLASTVCMGPWPSLMDFSIHRHLIGLLGWGISPTQGLYQNTETHRHTSMPWAGFEPAISMSGSHRQYMSQTAWLLRPACIHFTHWKTWCLGSDLSKVSSILQS
jgi:hypothetical protein